MASKTTAAARIEQLQQELEAAKAELAQEASAAPKKSPKARVAKRTAQPPFTRATAEKLGWSFVQDAPAHVISAFETQGITRTRAASLIAEKTVTVGSVDSRTTEEAETMEKLLERIQLVEAEYAARGVS